MSTVLPLMLNNGSVMTQAQIIALLADTYIKRDGTSPATTGTIQFGNATSTNYNQILNGVSTGGGLNWMQFLDGGVSQGALQMIFGNVGFLVTTAFFVGLGFGNFQQITAGGTGYTAPLHSFSGAISCDNNIKCATAGTGFFVKEGSNAKMGTGTLVAGTLTINTTAVTANSRIFLQSTGLNGSAKIGRLDVTAKVAGTSFTVTAYDPSAAVVPETSTFNWIIYEPA